MASDLILKIAVPAPFDNGLEYLLSSDLYLNFENINNYKNLIGLRALVPLGSRKVVGVIINILNKSNSSFKLKKVIEIIDSKPIFSGKLRELFNWMHGYYHTPLGIIYKTAWPTPISQGRLSWLDQEIKLDKKSDKKLALESQSIIKKNNNFKSNFKLNYKLSDEQDFAVKGISEYLNKFSTHVLHGVTGSGKTEVYSQLISRVLDNNKSVLVLIPEINLTPQMMKRFSARFSVPIISLHSKITHIKRLKLWQQINNSCNKNSAQIILGTRSSVFVPADNIGMIIIDECHDLSYQQQSDLRYCAIKVALIRAKLFNIPIILGSATPSCEILSQVKQKKYYYWSLKSRVEALHKLSYSIIDLRGQKLNGGLTNKLLDVISEHLEKKGQVFIFINRRGFSPLVLCNSCGEIPECKNCSCKLTYHQDYNKLLCHHCNYSKKIDIKFDLCSKCNESVLVPIGAGTQRVESVLSEKFPNHKVVRVDSNTTSRKGEFEDILNKIHSGEADILVGTQMLAKGHHFPNLTLVAMVNLDDALFSSDFRAIERLGQLLVQVSGRAGRAEKAGEVCLQTYQPDHPDLQLLLSNGWDRFSENILNKRAECYLPPFSFEAIWRAEGKYINKVNQLLLNIKEISQPYLDDNLFCMGPVPALLGKKAGMHQCQLLIRSNSRKLLHGLISHQKKNLELIKISGVRVFLELDPVMA